jgi:hypothetical protein
MAADHDVLQHRHAAEEAEILEGAADAERGDAVARRLRQASPLEENTAAIEAVEPAEAVEERRLARAVRSDEAADLPGFDREGDAVERDDPAEADRDIADGEKRLARR